MRKKYAKRGQIPLFLKQAEAHAGGCLMWPFAIDSVGYGAFTRGGVFHRAHVEICTRVNGPRPTAQHHASHRCGERACCAPAHLRWALPEVNASDRYAHGTMFEGADTPCAKLTPVEVLAIRKDRRTQQVIADEYGVSQSTISCVKREVRWRWL